MELMLVRVGFNSVFLSIDRYKDVLLPAGFTLTHDEAVKESVKGREVSI